MVIERLLGEHREMEEHGGGKSQYIFYPLHSPLCLCVLRGDVTQSIGLCHLVRERFLGEHREMEEHGGESLNIFSKSSPFSSV